LHTKEAFVPCRVAYRICCLLLAAAGISFGQSTALLTGSVTDSSGAVVAGAQVKCWNTDTDLRVTSTTNADGLFRFPDLPVGPYEVSVSQQGFETLVRRGIRTYTGQTLDISLTLTVGQSSQSVEVSAPVPLVQTTTSEVRTTIDSRQMSDLPLNGRNTFDLAVLTPGSVNTDAGTVPGQADNTGLSVNGLTTISNNWVLDGASYTNRQFGSAPSLPNPDTLQEFSVATSNYSADTQGGGASVKMTTRSGTNQFHGTMFEFLRNDSMDARNFFAVEPQDYKQNQYGGTLGGPVRRNKLFFFGSFQGTNKRGSPSPITATVPSAAVRSGNFSGGATIVDPTTGQPFPGNMIPQNRLDPIAVKIFPYIPVPNSGSNLLVFSPPGTLDDYQYLAKADYLITDNDHLSFRYFYDHHTAADAPSLPAFGGNNSYLNQTATLSETHTFSPTWVMTSFFNTFWIRRSDASTSPVSFQGLGAQVTPAAVAEGNKLVLTITGYTDITAVGGSIMTPVTNELQVNVSHAAGRHLIRFGAGGEHTNDYTFNHAANENGKWSYNLSRTSTSSIKGSGDAVASFLLGLPSTFAQASAVPQRFILNSFQPWIQDDWKATSRLTLNLGLRWEPAFEPYDARNITPGFDPGATSTIAPLAPKSMVFTGDPGIAHSIVHNHYGNLSPRIGFAWDAFGNGKTVIRAGYGFFRPPQDLDTLIRSLDSPAFSTLSVSIPNPPSTVNPYAGYPGGDPFPFTPPSGSGLSKYQFPANAAIRMLDVNASPGYTQSWNFTIERQVAAGAAVSVSYLGNHSIGLMSRYEANPAVYGPGATVGNENSRRLYPGIGQLTLGTSYNHGAYDALQVQFTKRAAFGLNLMANYTWSKSFDLDSSGLFGTALSSGPSNPFNLGGGYAPSDYDATHQLKIAALYDIPSLRAGPRALRGVVNDWQFNVMVVAHTGFPFTCRSGVDNSLSGVGNDSCDQVTANSGRPAGANPLLQWFNTAAFTTNAIGTFGDAGRNDMRRPGLFNLNASLFRHFDISERWKLELRGEAFNALNHPFLYLFYSGGAYGSVETLGPTFGQITYAGDPRLMQVALKLRF
jgi:hypothetical protein